MKLNLETNNKNEERIKTYLEQNANSYLEDKINNGVKITKNDKELINKKTINGFFKYASNEARKLAEKGANYACIEDDIVFGWAIHYFEEDTIEEQLYNIDGTPFKETKTSSKQTNVKTMPAKKQNNQVSLFDSLLTENENENEIDVDIPNEIEENEEYPNQEEINEILNELHKNEEKEIIDHSTGEIIQDEKLTIINKIFKDNIEVRLWKLTRLNQFQNTYWQKLKR